MSSFVIPADESTGLEVAANQMAGADLLGYLHNDHGNAQRLILMSGPEMRFVHAFKKWMIWDRRRWAVDDTEQAKRLAKLAMFEFLKQAVERKETAAEKFAKQSLDEKRINATLAMARPELAIQPSELDQHPYLLNFLNGTVDLRTGELLQHNPDHFITKLVHFDYSPSRTRETFVAFLKRIMGAGESEESQIRAARLMDFLQTAIGYSLTGITSEKAVFILSGCGDNGKTTFLELFRYLLSEYAVLLQIDTLMAKASENNNTQSDLADLRGARFAMTSETEKGQRLAEGKLKRITQGMGKIKAVRKYENPIEFLETHKLWMDANHKPVVRGTDNAIWNRLHLIPFDVTIPKEQQDRGLSMKLRDEAEGILAWAAYGAQRWFEYGLGKPDEVTSAVRRWRDDSDDLKDFIADVCDVSADARCTVAELRKAFLAWCEQNGERRPLSSRDFKESLEEKGFHQERKKDSRHWVGIELKG